MSVGVAGASASWVPSRACGEAALRHVYGSVQAGTVHLEPICAKARRRVGFRPERMVRAEHTRCANESIDAAERTGCIGCDLCACEQTLVAPPRDPDATVLGHDELVGLGPGKVATQ